MKKIFLIFLLILFLLQLRLWSSDGGVTEWLRLQNELANQQAKLDVLKARNDALKNIVIDLQQHTEAIETQAREVLHFIAPNETFFRVIPISDTVSTPYLPPLPKTKLSSVVDETVTTAEDAAVELPIP
jgi:cell division protein FtsB